MSGKNNEGKAEKPEKDKPKLEDKHVDVTVIVNGTPEAIKIKTDHPLRLLLQKALEKSENTGQPLENWELRNEAGGELDLDLTVEAAGIETGDVLSANLKTGAAG
ncbi:MAG: DUF2604 domain-containing protein [Pseudomonadota bacterium]|nr:DUF2604 domain-containing protein [Pseudomonadota bacterium]